MGSEQIKSASENLTRRVVLHHMQLSELQTLIEQHSPALTLLARQYTVAPEDAVQTAFARLVAWPTSPADPAAWLFRTVRNAAIDQGKAERRRRHRESAVARQECWFREETIEGLDAEVAVEALLKLPCEQREVIVLRLWSDLTLEQIASASGCSVSTAHRRQEAGLAKLRLLLGDSCTTTSKPA